MFKVIATLIFNGERFEVGSTVEEKSLKGIPENFLEAHFKEIKEEGEEVEEETEEENSETPTRKRRSK